MKRAMMFFCTTVVFATLGYGGDTMLTKGTEAPSFKLATAEGKPVKLDDFRDKKFVVLVFYPGDETPVCTQQLCELRDDYSSFEKCDAVVFGINPGSAKSHTKFSDKHQFQFPLLVDPKGSVAALYGAKGAIMNKRMVYIVDKSGKVIFAERGKPPVADILAAIPCGSEDRQVVPEE
ncbi:MAG: peroxiredoxin [Chitinispirillaceae bacterium]|nr:peroxiredoxin [Chitinispirillaceae bacterium]